MFSKRLLSVLIALVQCLMFQQNTFALGFTATSHEVNLTNEGVVYLRASSGVIRPECAAFPTPVSCGASEIVQARQADDPTDVRLGDLFVLPGPTVVLYDPQCRLSESGCLAKVTASIGISGMYDVAPYQARIGDVNGDGYQDLLLWAQVGAQADESYILLSANQTTASVVSLHQIVPNNIYGDSLLHYKSVDLIDYNRDGFADLVGTPFGGGTTVVALTKDPRTLIPSLTAPTLIALKPSQPSIFVPPKILPDYPIEGAACNFDLQTPSGRRPVEVLFNEKCTMAFVPPPAVGLAKVSNIKRRYNLTFCPTLTQAGSNVNSNNSKIFALSERLVAIVLAMAHDTASTSLKTQYDAVKNSTSESSTTYKMEFESFNTLRHQYEATERGLDDCVRSGLDCNANYTSASSLYAQLQRQKAVLERAFASYFRLADQEEELEDALRSNQLSLAQQIAAIQALIDEFNAIIQLNLDMFQEFSALEGAVVRYDFSLNRANFTSEYQSTNPLVPVMWKDLPLKSVTYLTNLASMTTGISAPPVLWMKTAEGYYDYQSLPDGTAVVSLNTGTTASNTNAPNISDTASVDLGLGLANACTYFPDAASLPSVPSFNNLIALTPVNVQYTYDVVTFEDYAVTYNLANLAEQLLNKPIAKSIIEDVVAGKIHAGLTLGSISQLDIAQLIESRNDANWFALTFKTGSSNLSLQQQEEIRLAVKGELISSVLNKTSIAYRNDPIQQRSISNYAPNNVPAIMGVCWRRYGSICRYNNYQLGGSTQLANFTSQNTGWQTRIVNTRLVERSAGTTFESYPTNPVTTVEAPLLGPQLSAYPSTNTALYLESGATLPSIIDLHVVLRPGHYFVTNSIFIETTGSLSILEGAQLEFSPHTEMLVEGKLVVSGRETKHVAFTSNNSTLVKWKGIAVKTDGVVLIENADITNAENAIEVIGGRLEIFNSQISDYLNFALEFKSGGGGIVQHNTFDNHGSSGTAIKMVDAAPDVEKRTLTIKNNKITGSHVGIEVGSRSTPIIMENTLYGNTYGIYVNAGGSVGTGKNPIPTIQSNNIYLNSMSNLKADGFVLPIKANLNVKNNWWGTTDNVVIQQGINNDATVGSAPTIMFTPYLLTEVVLP